MSYKAICIWSGPDIMLVIADEEYGIMLCEKPKHKHRAEHGFCGKGYIDLTIEQAREFSKELNEAIVRFDEMDTEYQQYYLEQEAKEKGGE